MTAATEIKIPRMIGIDDAAEMFGLTRYFVRQLCLQKRIVFVKAGKKYLVNAERLADYLNRGDEV